MRRGLWVLVSVGMLVSVPAWAPAGSAHAQARAPHPGLDVPVDAYDPNPPDPNAIDWERVGFLVIALAVLALVSWFVFKTLTEDANAANHPTLADQASPPAAGPEVEPEVGEDEKTPT